MSHDTKNRLLEVAGSVFADQGFRAASIREICQRANVNIAAVNYHFGDKEGIYTEVLRQAYRQALSGPVEFLLASKLPAEDKLRRFIETILQRRASPADVTWHGKLITRELLDPSPTLETAVRELLTPLLGKLTELMREFLGPDAPPEQVQHCALSVLGHCIYFEFNQPLLARLAPNEGSGPERVQQLVDHIYQFSLGGIRQIKGSVAPALADHLQAWNVGSD
jgi:AcrR family transcriptional regulator